MSLFPPKSEPDPKLDPHTNQTTSRLPNIVAVSPALLGKQEPEHAQHGFLSTPLSGPVRPLSPDTVSNLSIEEYEQLRPGRSQRRPLEAFRIASQSPAPPRGWRGRLNAFYVHNLGLGYMLLAQIFGTLMNVTIRFLEIEGNKGKGMHPFQIIFARMGITLVLASAYMWYRRTPYFPLGMPEVRWLLAARGFGGFFGVFGMYYSLLYLPLADATVITFLAPGLACWACSILIHEPFTRIEQIAGLISLVGVALIAKPISLFAALSGSSNSLPASGNGDAIPMTNTTAPAIPADASNYDSVTPVQRLSAVGIALVGVMGAATAYTTIRWIGKRAHPLISVNYFAVWCFIVSIVAQTFLPDVGFLLPADLKEWGYLLFLGLCGFIMQFLLAAGLAYEKSSRATNIAYTQMLFALTFDKFVFGHTPDFTSIIGSTLILGSAICVATQVSPTESKRPTGGSQGLGNEESRHGLISGMDVQTGEDHDRLPIQEVQLRTLR